jgi:hypothetical protein
LLACFHVDPTLFTGLMIPDLRLAIASPRNHAVPGRAYTADEYGTDHDERHRASARIEQHDHPLISRKYAFNYAHGALIDSE